LINYGLLRAHGTPGCQIDCTMLIFRNCLEDKYKYGLFDIDQYRN